MFQRIPPFWMQPAGLSVWPVGVIYGVVILALAIFFFGNPPWGRSQSIGGRWNGDDRQIPAYPAHHEQLNLVQRGRALTGTLLTPDGRSGTLVGRVAGKRVEGMIAFHDECAGRAELALEIVGELYGWVGDHRLLEGSLRVSDCHGSSVFSIRVRR